MVVTAIVNYSNRTLFLKISRNMSNYFKNKNTTTYQKWFSITNFEPSPNGGGFIFISDERID